VSRARRHRRDGVAACARQSLEKAMGASARSFIGSPLWLATSCQVTSWCSKMAGVDVDNTLHFPTTVTGQIFWKACCFGRWRHRSQAGQADADPDECGRRGRRSPTDRGAPSRSTS